LPEQDGEPKPAKPHVSGEHDEQAKGKAVTKSVGQGLGDACLILPQMNRLVWWFYSL
jgi:hypothetical protein